MSGDEAVGTSSGVLEVWSCAECESSAESARIGLMMCPTFMCRIE